MPQRDEPEDVGDRRYESASLSRRAFLQSAAAAGLTLAAGSRLAQDAAAATRRPPSSELSFQDFELSEITITELQQGMREGRWTARGVTELYLRRIEHIDRSGPHLRSVIEVNPDAVSIAAALDRERSAGKVRGPLHGVPVLLKDVVDTADRMRTTAGSLALASSFARQDAFIVARLREAGAVIIGKTNMSEWSNIRSPLSTSGWSARGGLTRNPYILDRTACGSSSGGGAAIAANLAMVGVAAETDGSIACPASANSLVGIKPTVGLLSRSGLIPVSFTQDTAGPMARTVRDAAILLGALAGVDQRDPAMAASGRNAPTDYAKSLDKGALKGARLGIMRRSKESDPTLDRVLDQSIEILESAGAIIVPNVQIPTIEELAGPETFVLICEFKDAIGEYLSTRGPDERHRSLADLIRFNEENAAAEMPWFGQEFFLASEKTNGRSTDRYREALAACARLSRTQGLDRALGEHRVEALVGLAATAPFATDLVLGDRPIVRNSSLSAVSGYPRITVPAGFTHGLPIGLSFMGPPWSEERLLGLAFSFEQSAPARRPPQFLPHPLVDK